MPASHHLIATNDADIGLLLRRHGGTQEVETPTQVPRERRVSDLQSFVAQIGLHAPHLVKLPEPSAIVGCDLAWLARDQDSPSRRAAAGFFGKKPFVNDPSITFLHSLIQEKLVAVPRSRFSRRLHEQGVVGVNRKLYPHSTRSP